jgi:hypothetical protein
MSTGPEVEYARERASRMQRWALCIGIPALIVCIVFAWWVPEQFFRAYLAAHQFFLGITLGCLVILMLYHLTGGAWGYLLSPILESAARTLPLMAVLFTPIAYGVGYLYLWSRPGLLDAYPSLRHQKIYLNPPFFWGRVAIYFILWSTLAYLLTAWSRRAEQTGDPRYARWMSALSGPGLVLYGITITFAAVDWEMSLQPAFRSSLFGVVVALGQVVSALSFAIVALVWLARRSELAKVVAPQTLGDLGNLLLGFLLLWCYAYYFQFMLIWIADLPNEVAWYLVKGRDGWGWVGLALFLLLFVAPFLLLLFRAVKRSPRTLGWVMGLVLFMRLVCVYYDYMPNFPGTTIGQHWMDFLTPMGIGSVWLAAFLWLLFRRPLLARHDESRVSALHLRAAHLKEELREVMRAQEEEEVEVIEHA